MMCSSKSLQLDLLGHNAPPPPGILYGRHRWHSLARWMLLAMPPENHHRFVMRGQLPGDERDFRFYKIPSYTFTRHFEHYLFINKLILRAQKFAEQHPAQKPLEPFLHWWQCGIEAVGEQCFLLDKSVEAGNYWNATNQWQLIPKEQHVLHAYAVLLNTREKKMLLCFMVTLFQPPRGVALAKHLDLDMEETRFLHAETRRLIFNLLATFSSF